jgi:hypothetical protein
MHLNRSERVKARQLVPETENEDPPNLPRPRTTKAPHVQGFHEGGATGLEPATAWTTSGSSLFCECVVLQGFRATTGTTLAAHICADSLGFAAFQALLGKSAWATTTLPGPAAMASSARHEQAPASQDPHGPHRATVQRLLRLAA